MTTEATEVRPGAWAWASFLALDPRDQVEHIVQEMTEVVYAQGQDFRYREVPSCQYVRDGMPSCLVGVVLHRLGLSLERLRACDELSDQRIANLWRSLGLSRDAGAVLTVAQSIQDIGDTWGSALDHATALQDALYLHEG